MGWFGSVLSVTHGGETFQMVLRTLDFEHDEMSGKERKSWCRPDRMPLNPRLPTDDIS
jgi:hypothetical protein